MCVYVHTPKGKLDSFRSHLSAPSTKLGLQDFNSVLSEMTFSPAYQKLLFQVCVQSCKLLRVFVLAEDCQHRALQACLVMNHFATHLSHTRGHQASVDLHTCCPLQEVNSRQRFKLINLFQNIKTHPRTPAASIGRTKD